MPTILDTPPGSGAQTSRSRHKFTWQQVDAMVAARQLSESGYELIDGDLLDKMTKNAPHILVTRNAFFGLSDRFGRERVFSQDPLVIDDTNQPEPDVYVIADTANPVQAGRKPSASEVVLVVEVADSSLAYDRTDKARLYARAGIPEYWVIDIEGRRMIVHRGPNDATYSEVVAYAEDEAVPPLALPGTTISVGEFLRGV